MLVAAILLLPRFCKPAKPLNEVLDVDNELDNDAVTEKIETTSQCKANNRKDRHNKDKH